MKEKKLFCQHRLLQWDFKFVASFRRASGFTMKLPARCFLSSADSRSPLLPPLAETEDTLDPNWCEVKGGLWWPPRPKCEVGPPAAAPKIRDPISMNFNFMMVPVCVLTIPGPTSSCCGLSIEHSKFVINGICCGRTQMTGRLFLGSGQVP